MWTSVCALGRVDDTIPNTDARPHSTVQIDLTDTLADINCATYLACLRSRISPEQLCTFSAIGHIPATRQ